MAVRLGGSLQEEREYLGEFEVRRMNLPLEARNSSG